MSENAGLRSRKSQKRNSVVLPLGGEDVHEQQRKAEKMEALKWNMAVGCMAMRFLLDGMEYAIVLPTLYGFLVKINANIEFIGIIVAAYAMGGFIAGPAFGWFADKFGTGKLVICFGCILSISGNLVYFFAQSKYHLAAARFLCGMSSGVEPVILGEIGKNEHVKPEKRSSLFSMLLGIRQAGMLLGPLVVIIFADINVTIGSFSIDKSNMGGLFCATMFAICLTCFVLFFDIANQKPVKDESEVDQLSVERYQVNNRAQQQNSDEAFNNMLTPEIHTSSQRRETKESAMDINIAGSGNNLLDASDQRDRKGTIGALPLDFPKMGMDGLNLMSQHNPMGGFKAPSQITADFLDGEETYSQYNNKYDKRHSREWSNSPTSTDNDPDIAEQSLKDLLCEPVLIGLFGTYSIFVQQATVETVMTPTTAMILGWQEKENAYMLVAVGFELLLAFLTVGPIAKKIGDTGVLRLGTGAISAIVVFICLYAPYSAREVWWLMPVFVLSVAAFVFFMPYIVIGTAAVLSRAVPTHQQSTVQGLRTACERFGQVLGPLLAGQSLNWNLIWIFLPPGLHIFLVFIMCNFSKSAISLEALSDFANGTVARKIRAKKAEEELLRKMKKKNVNKKKGRDARSKDTLIEKYVRKQ